MMILEFFLVGGNGGGACDVCNYVSNRTRTYLLTLKTATGDKEPYREDG